MGRTAYDGLIQRKIECEWLDLGELDLPLCDANQCYEHPATLKVNTAIESADGIIVAAPVYNFDVSASAKNLIELTGSAWEDKIVGFLCAAGGMSSYMSVMAYASSLMLDFRCVIIPRFVYATGSSFADGELKDAKIVERIEQVSSELVRFTEALRS